MIRDLSVYAAPRARLILLGLGLLLLTALLVPVLWSDRGRLALQTLVAVAGLVWLFRMPHWGVWAILTMWLAEVSPLILGIRYLGIPYLVGAVLVIPVGLAILRDGTIRVWRVPQVKILSAIGMLFVASTAWSYFQYPVAIFPALDETGKMMVRFGTRLMFLVLFLYFITTPRRIQLTAWLMVGLITASAVSAVLPYLTGGPTELAPGEAYRAAAAFGVGETPNYLAFLCLLGTAFVWFHRLHGEVRWAKRAALLLLLFLPATSLLTGSRNGFISMTVLIMMILKEQTSWSATKRTRSLFFAGAVGVLLFLTLPAAQLMRATSFDPHGTAAGHQSLQDRAQTIYAGVEMVASNPILGIGIGNFRWMHLTSYGSDRQPHNAYLWALVSSGLGALGLYLLLFYVTYRGLKRFEQSRPGELLWVSKGLRVGLIVFLVFSMFADLWLDDILFIIVGLAVSLVSLAAPRGRALGPV